MFCDYLLKTAPTEYSFIGFYKYRKDQPDFSFSFAKDKTALDILLDNEIEGIAFLELTKEELMADGMKTWTCEYEHPPKRARTTGLFKLLKDPGLT
ncbi:8997_t:CDS:2, partial [Ambispora leptoticha]